MGSIPTISTKISVAKIGPWFDPRREPTKYLMRICEVIDKEFKSQVSGGKKAWDSVHSTGQESPNYFQGRINHMTKPQRGLSSKDLNNISNYVFKDLPPSGEVAMSLDKAVAAAPAINTAFVSYRGLLLPARLVSKITAQIDATGSYLFTNKSPSSWSNSQSVAWDFVKKSGHRRTADDARIPIVFEVLIPKGTKIARLSLSFGVGHEHVLRSQSKIEFLKARKYREGLVLTGRLIQ